MSSIRLLVLGVVRFAQPVHGYDVRRELLSWQLGDVSHVKPGSIYSALKILERDGLLRALGSERASGRPERTTYELTGEGDKEFMLLLRKYWWTAEQAVEPLVPALTMMLALSREELIAALSSRMDQLRGHVRQNDFLLATITDGATGADGAIPEHVREIALFLQAKLSGEIDWATGFLARLRAGAYTTAGEPGSVQLGAGRGWSAAVRGGHVAAKTVDFS